MIWKKYNEIQSTNNKMYLDNRKMPLSSAYSTIKKYNSKEYFSFSKVLYRVAHSVS